MRYWHKKTGRSGPTRHITESEAAWLGLTWHEQNDTTCPCGKIGSFITEERNAVCFDCAYTAARFAENFATKIPDSYSTARRLLNPTAVNA